MKFDELIVHHLGEFGPYQKRQFLLVCLPTIFTAMHALSWTFSGANPLHRCRLPDEVGVDVEATGGYWLNGSEAVMGNSLLKEQHCDLKAHPGWPRCPYDSCEMSNGNPCRAGYVYDLSELHYSATYRWNIVCDRSVLKAVIQSMYYIGQMAGSLVFGYLGDRWGRKRVFFIAILVQIVSGLGMVVAPYWTLFSLFRVGVGFAHPGIFVIAVVIGMELVGPSKRKAGSVFTGATFGVGQIILGILAYYIRDYQYLQAAIAVPSLVFIVYWWVIPESARWLVSQRRFEEADVILRRVAHVNKSHLPERWWEEVEEASLTPAAKDDGKDNGGNGGGRGAKTQKQRRHNFLDLVRTPRLRCRSLAVFFCWPVVSLVYYGVSMNTNFLGGDLYSTFIFGAIMEIPAIFLVYTTADVLGRRTLLAVGYTITALCMLSNLGWSLATGSEEVHWLVALVQFLVAKGAITGTYATIYMFTPELFPTVIRNQAMGVSSMMARVGAIAASYISMWLVERYGKVAMIVPFASLALAAAFVTLMFLPETKGRPLPESIEEVEGEPKAFEMTPLAPNTSGGASSAELLKGAGGEKTE